MANDPSRLSFERDGRAALNLMKQALILLDNCGSTAEVGAHLDLAICRLKEALGKAEPSS